MKFKSWTNNDSTIMVQMWEDGAVYIVHRRDSSGTWGLPEKLKPNTPQQTTLDTKETQ